MTLTYNKLSKTPRIFNNLTGLTIDQFNQLLDSVQDEIILYNQSKFKTKGDLLLWYLIYLRTNICNIFLGYLFNLDASNICRNFKKLDNKLSLIVNKGMEKLKLNIKKDLSLTKDKILELIVDVTELEIDRPKNKDKRKKTYSGKKKQYLKKKEIVVTKDKMIISVSKVYDGSIHDLTIRRSEKEIDDIIGSDKYQLYCDKGYIGLENNNIFIPKKEYQNKSLSLQDISQNKDINRKRIKVEHVFKDMKIFKSLKDKCRNFIEDAFNKRFMVIAGLVNLKNSFWEK